MIRILNCIALAGMLVINFIAATTGINDYETGDVSALNPTQFTPAGFTFSIWSLIYLGLISFCIVQFKADKKYIDSVSVLFILSCLFNAAWLFAWHHLMFFLAVIIMIALLITLMLLYRRIKKVPVERIKVWFLKTPFSIYLAWVSVALITNIAVYFNNIDFNTYPELFTVLLIIATFGLAVYMIGFHQDLFFGLTICWALFGIAHKYWRYPDHENLVITPVVGIIVILVFSIVQRPKYFSKHSIIS